MKLGGDIEGTQVWRWMKMKINFDGLRSFFNGVGCYLYKASRIGDPCLSTYKLITTI